MTEIDMTSQEKNNTRLCSKENVREPSALKL